MRWLIACLVLLFNVALVPAAPPAQVKARALALLTLEKSARERGPLWRDLAAANVFAAEFAKWRFPGTWGPDADRHRQEDGYWDRLRRWDAAAAKEGRPRLVFCDLPPLALEFARKLCREVGGCMEVFITAYAVYANIVEGLPCNDDLYEPRGVDRAWFSERMAQSNQLDALLTAADLTSEVDRKMLSDLLEEQGRTAEASLLRDLAKKVGWQDGRIIQINEAIITYCEQQAKVVCDRNCSKAWGTQSRPKVQLSDDEDMEDDYYFLADGELGEAPANPGTYEGEHGKPRSPDGFPNKWCVRECERCEMSSPGEWMLPLPVRSFAKRSYNIPSSEPKTT